MGYNTNIFINCPFDNDYYALLKPILFTCIFCKLVPRLSETQDGDDIRIRQIQKLIKQSKYSIHDISRILPSSFPAKNKSQKKDKYPLPRFNMPFELGLDLGCKHYLKKDKKCLILEEKPYRYIEVISDIAGQDISNHKNDPFRAVKVVRNWIYTVTTDQKSKPPSYKVIWDLYNEFLFDYETSLKNEDIDPNKIWEIPFSEVIDWMKEWIDNKNRSFKK